MCLEFKCNVSLSLKGHSSQSPPGGNATVGNETCSEWLSVENTKQFTQRHPPIKGGSGRAPSQTRGSPVPDPTRVSVLALSREALSMIQISDEP